MAFDDSRLFRDSLYAQLFLRDLRETGCQLAYTTRERRDTPQGRHDDTMHAADAQLEREKIRERTMRGRYEAADAGRKQAKFMGGPIPFGYAVHEGNLIPGQHAETVKRMFSWTLEKASCHAIAQRLDNQGIKPPRGKRWFRSTVRRILVNPVYSGETTFTPAEDNPAGNDPITITTPALVTKEVFLRAQQQ